MDETNYKENDRVFNEDFGYGVVESINLSGALVKFNQFPIALPIKDSELKLIERIEFPEPILMSEVWEEHGRALARTATNILLAGEIPEKRLEERISLCIQAMDTCRGLEVLV